jgi:hypothetical protein
MDQSIVRALFEKLRGFQSKARFLLMLVSKKKPKGKILLNPTMQLIGFFFLSSRMRSHVFQFTKGQTILCCLKAKVKVV